MNGTSFSLYSQPMLRKPKRTMVWVKRSRGDQYTRRDRWGEGYRRVRQDPETRQSSESRFGTQHISMVSCWRWQFPSNYLREIGGVVGVVVPEDFRMNSTEVTDQ